MSRLVRFVTLRFRPDGVAHFMEIFDEVQPRIQSFPGCLYVEVAADPFEPDTYYTLSLWAGADALEAYRSSELFAATWQRTRQLFRAKPSAMSWTLTLPPGATLPQ
ncbi:MAG: antibiotic biosynthesis monooxygenase [Bacteroidetes bacterium]|nr:antibiotic biosynthesis monooxygenase [Bacteroidota bacterium]